MTVREELFRNIKAQLEKICVNGADELFTAPDDVDSDLFEKAIKHIDLWNHNVEFIEQETAWGRPAVFIEFQPIKWNPIVIGVEYRAEPLIKLHIVTDWEGSSAEGSELQEDALKVFDLPGLIHARLAGLSGETFLELDLVESDTNHNHEDIVESIEVYQCVAIKRLQ